MLVDNVNQKLEASVAINLRKKENEKKSLKHYLLIWSNNTSVNSVVLTVMCAITSHGGGEDGCRPDSAVQDPGRGGPGSRSVPEPVSSCTGNQWGGGVGPVTWASKVTSRSRSHYLISAKKVKSNGSCASLNIFPRALTVKQITAKHETLVQ